MLCRKARRGRGGSNARRGGPIPRSKSQPRSDTAVKPPLLALAEKTLEDGKAEDLTVIDLQGKSGIADYLVIATGRSQRQVVALAERMLEALKAGGYGRHAAEGMRHGDWVLIDARDIIIHIFRPEVRGFYNLEKMWGESLGEPATPVLA